MAATTIQRFKRVFIRFNPGPTGPPTWVLGSAADRSSASSVISSGTFQPANGQAVAEGTPLFFRSQTLLDVAQAIEGLTPAGPHPYEMVGLASRAAAPGDVVGLLSDGRIGRASWLDLTGTVKLQSGSRYYLSAGQPGKLTLQCPTAPGTAVVRVGQALSAEVLEVELDILFLQP